MKPIMTHQTKRMAITVGAILAVGIVIVLLSRLNAQAPGEPTIGKEQATVIEGRVVDGLGKKPKAGVDVVAAALNHRGKTDVRRGATKTELLQHVKTDLEGRFRFLVRRASPDDIAFEVFAFTAGYAVDWACLDVSRGEYCTASN